MVGSILSNFWVALFAFSIYFFLSYPFLEGISVLYGASFWAFIFFILAFIARALIAFIIKDSDIGTHENVTILDESETKSDISPEKYAELVKGMLKD